MLGNPAQIDRISAAIDRSFELNDLPGLAVSVGLGPDITVDRVYGFSDYQEKDPLEVDAVFHCASISKLFVATAVMILIESGRLDMDDLLLPALPWFRPADAGYGRVTIGMLMSHTAGIVDVEDYHWRDGEKDAASLKKYLKSSEVAGKPLRGAPGFSYSNVGYELLGAVIAELTGMTFEEALKELIFKKLGMADSTFLTFLRPQARLVRPHEKDPDRNIRRLDYYPYTRQHAPSSTLTSTTSDLRKFADAFMSRDPALLSESSYEAMWRPVADVTDKGAYGPAMGLGWFIRDWNGVKLYGHDGSDDGFRTSFWLCPEYDLRMIALANITEANMKNIIQSVYNEVIDTTIDPVQ